MILARFESRANSRSSPAIQTRRQQELATISVWEERVRWVEDGRDGWGMSGDADQSELRSTGHEMAGEVVCRRVLLVFSFVRVSCGRPPATPREEARVAPSM